MTFTIHYYFTVLHALGHDWFPMKSSVAGMTFMNEFAPCEVLAPPPQQFVSCV